MSGGAAFCVHDRRSILTTTKPFKLAVLWSGDRALRSSATPDNNRYSRIFAELAALGIDAVPAIYADDMESEVREQLLQVDGVLVWVNPIFDGGNRAVLDAMLRDVAAKGIWVSAHPDMILKMGTKEILFRTKHLGWGADTRLYRTRDEFRSAFPSTLRSAEPRVLKQNRGNGGEGVWKVELSPSSIDRVTVLQATKGSVPQEVALARFMEGCESYLEGDGCIIDQAFQPRLPEGMIRCYMGADKVVGFGHQLIKALVTSPVDGPPAEPGPRIMHDTAAPAFQALRRKMETDWVPQMTKVLDIDRASLPIIWDADFLYGPRTAAGDDSYVLCEINVSCVFPIPDGAPADIARLSLARLISR
ncbi:Cj0069 family protein [Reyranella sp.]|uniref:Cj0069 family protein n=1 Tax=Reyranella sp. TaxID=1929291 RepID=UPI002726259B|nr:Cj0069 family protein [Reyranella sp.]MDO8972414.1 Cj0069 family protein [Reyranella sp.]